MSKLQPNGAAMLHTMQRHKDILKDYKLEFNKIRNNFAARRDREDLLGNVRKEIEYVYLLLYYFELPFPFTCFTDEFIYVLWSTVITKV